MTNICFYSGGKDSCYNMMQCVANGHDIAAIANLKPPSESGKGEPHIA
jgi:diphthine-ammonia ligase